MKLKRYLLKITVVFWLSAIFGLPMVSAESSPPSDPARKCIMCHKKDNAKMLGHHAQALNPHNNTTVNCTNCHTSIDPEAKAHPQNRSNITQYRPLSPLINHSTETANKIEEPKNEEADNSASPVLPKPLAAIEQNAQCMSCHTPEKLRVSFWTHDVHAATLSCSDCHKLHPDTDPALKINETKKVELCLNCHASPSKKQETLP